MQANQEVFGSFPGHIVLYLLFAVVLAIFSYRVYHLYGLLRLGRAEDRLDNLKWRIACERSMSLTDPMPSHRGHMPPVT